MPMKNAMSGRGAGSIAHRSPAELVAAAADGDQDAWRVLVGRYGRLVWSVLAGTGLDRASMGDAYQTVWLRLCEHVGRIREPDRLGTWLATTARREAGRLRRERARMLPADAAVDADDRGSAQPGDRLLDDELLAEVRLALDQIDEVSRRTLHLLYAGPRPAYRHIAEQTGRPLGSIGPTRARALAKLRQHLYAGGEHPCGPGAATRT